MPRYRKWGRSVRREGAYRISIDEAGEAIEERGAFRARSLQDQADLPPPDVEAVEAMARAIESVVRAPLVIERMIVSDGIVEHEVLPVTGNIRWREKTRRIHLSIARPPLRALIDLAEFCVDPVRPIVEALRRAGGERRAPRRVRLADHVGAALLSSLDIAMMQSAAPHDGNGQAIEEQPVSKATPPNWFRPTYRLPPRRAWFHLRAASIGEIDGDLPVAIALLAPVQKRSIRVLCVEGDAAYPATIEIARVLGARPARTWYPYGAGAFGAEIML